MVSSTGFLGANKLNAILIASCLHYQYRDIAQAHFMNANFAQNTEQVKVGKFVQKLALVISVIVFVDVSFTLEN